MAKYRPDIDGLRAVAIALVISYHAFPDRLHGGFIGVDVFFVISGFLISGIVFGNLEGGSLQLPAFYRRRIRRIFPALVTVLLACAIVGWFVLLGNEYRVLGKHVAAAALFAQNFMLWSESGYFDVDARAKPLLHLWSLAIEEQFYLLWPLLLAAIWRSKGNFLAIAASFAAASFAANIYLASNDRSADFYSPLSRCWELVAGSLVAYLALRRPAVFEKYGDARSMLGCACLVAGALCIDRDAAFPGWWALLPVLGTCLIISAGPAALLNRRMLGNRAMIGLGLISYPLYLWHWPIFSFAHIVRPAVDSSGSATIGLIALAVLLAIVTYEFVERPLRERARASGVPVLVTAMSAMLVAGVAIARLPVETRLGDTALSIPSQSDPDYLVARAADFDPGGTGVYRLHVDREPVTVFAGDSQLAQYAERLDAVASRKPRLNGAIFATGGGCPPIRNVFTDDPARRGCWRPRDEAFALARGSRVRNVVFGASWYWYFADDEYGSDYYVLRRDGTRVSMRTPLGRALALRALGDQIVAFRRLGKHVFLLIGNPIGNGFDPHVYFDRLDPSAGSLAPFAAFPASQRKIRERLLDLARRTGATVVDPYPTLCNGDRCRRISPSGVAIFKDATHFNARWAIENAGFVDDTLGSRAYGAN